MVNYKSALSVERIFSHRNKVIPMDALRPEKSQVPGVNTRYEAELREIAHGFWSEMMQKGVKKSASFAVNGLDNGTPDPQSGTVTSYTHNGKQMPFIIGKRRQQHMSGRHVYLFVAFFYDNKWWVSAGCRIMTFEAYYRYILTNRDIIGKERGNDAREGRFRITQTEQILDELLGFCLDYDEEHHNFVNVKILKPHKRGTITRKQALDAINSVQMDVDANQPPVSIRKAATRVSKKVRVVK